MTGRAERDCLLWATPLLICEYINFTEDNTKGIFLTKEAAYSFRKFAYSLINAIFGLIIIRYQNGYFIYNTFSVDFIANRKLSHIHFFPILIALQGLERNIILVVVMLIIVLSVQHYLAGKTYLWLILCRTLYLWFGLWCLRHFQQHFSYKVVVSFIRGGNQSTRRKPPTCRKSRTNLSHNVLSSTLRHNLRDDWHLLHR